MWSLRPSGDYGPAGEFPWRSQFVTSKADKMGLRYPPYAL